MRTDCGFAAYPSGEDCLVGAGDGNRIRVASLEDRAELRLMGSDLAMPTARCGPQNRG